MNRQEVNREITQMLGQVPGFFNTVPDSHIGPLWENMRNVQLYPGAIPPKYQQLVMLGVSTYAKCKYCTDFHTEVGRALGATKEEITETALLVGNTAQWSNILGGTQYDLDLFKREVRAACTFLAQQGARQGKSPGAPPMDTRRS